MTTLTHLECSRCAAQYDADKPQTVCACGGPLLARYDLDLARRSWSREWIRTGPDNIWRWAPVLPVRKPASIVSLGEGMTPLTRANRIGELLGTRQLWIKDEGMNPTGSFKARGLSCAVSMANELGLRRLVVGSSGSAASGLAACAAAAGLEAHAFMPSTAPHADYVQCTVFGAQVTLVTQGFIDECRRRAAAFASREGWFDISALREPYRVEGNKTVAYEIAEQMNWHAPDAILCPTGSGVGLIGMWKAITELEQLEWIAPGRRPKMILVQASGCAPLVRAFESGSEQAAPVKDATTIAAGLRVPDPPGASLALRAVRESGGTAVAVTDEEVLDAGLELARREGIFAAPEGAACVAAIPKLLANGTLAPDDRIVLCNTGSGLKYLETYATRLPGQSASEQDKLGGLITPR